MPRRRTTRTLRSRDTPLSLSWLSRGSRAPASSIYSTLLLSISWSLSPAQRSYHHTDFLTPTCCCYYSSMTPRYLSLYLISPPATTTAPSSAPSSRRLPHLGCSCKRSPTVPPPPPKPKQFVQCIKASNCSVAFLHSFRCSLSLTPLSLSHHGSYLRSPRPSISHSWLLATPRHVSISPPANHATTIAQQPQQPPPTASAVERR